MACASVLGCDFGGLSDIGESLLDPDAALLDRPGRKLASGTYSNLVVDGSLETGGSVLAFRSDAGDTRVAIVPFLSGEPCEVTPAVAFERVSSRVDVALPNLIAVQRSQNESSRGRISFVGRDCKPRIDDLDDATMPRIAFPTGQPRGLLTLTGDGALYLVDAEDAALVLIAQNVASARVSGNLLLTIEAGELVIRDEALEVLDRGGTEVRDLITTGGEKYEVAYVDDSGVGVWGKRDGFSTLSETGCQPVALGPDAVGFFDPCEDRRLNIQVAGRLVGREQAVRLVGPGQVIHAGRTHARWGLAAESTEITLLTSDNPEAISGTLRLAVVTRDAEAVDGVIELSTEPLVEGAGLFNGQVYENWNGSTGTLLTFERDTDGRVSGLLPLAERVVQLPGGTPFSEQGVLARFDDGAGTLVRLSTTEYDEVEEVVLGENVPLQNHAMEPETGNFAFVHEVANGSGTLGLVRSGTVSDVAEGVFVNTVRFLEQPRGVVYLSRSKRGVAELHAWLIDSELDLKIQDNVSEYRTLPWPSPGVLYAIPSGDDAGLWFSKAR